MSSSNRNRRWAGGVGTVGAAFAAALIGVANAAAARADTEPDPLQDLFGDTGINTWTPSADSFLASNDPTLAADLSTTVDNFESLIGQDDPISILAYEFDPSSFSVDPSDITYQIADGVPLNTTGDLALSLDLAGFASGLDTFGNPLDLPSEIFTLLFLPWLPLILGGA